MSDLLWLHMEGELGTGANGEPQELPGASCPGVQGGPGEGVGGVEAGRLGDGESGRLSAPSRR
jgi:hypothetical protein